MTVLWIVIAIVVVAVIAVAVVATQRRRSAMLRQRFGTEYDRTLEGHENQRGAEAELRDRERQRAKLDIKPLSADSRARYTEEWRAVQERFVDQPSAAAVAADSIVYRVMEERGYPMGDFEAQADLVSVDHPQVVENYRVAHGIQQRAESKRATTEDLRDALLRYRTLFDELLTDDRVRAEETDRANAETERAGQDTVRADENAQVRAEARTEDEVSAGTQTAPTAREARDVTGQSAVDEDRGERPDAGRAREPIRNTGRTEGV
jgi:hypothetical protein